MASSDLSCLFCKESFEDREQLQIHFRKHGDPKFNQNVKSNRSVSETESNLNAEVSNDAAEIVNCDVCADVFPTISKAITHKHKMHPDHDAKYFCPWCGKLFTMKHLYNKHIEKNHTSNESTGSGFRCDYCDVDFFAAAAMIYHNKFFHRQDTELASIGYSKKMKQYDQEVLPIYYCPFCGEEYINKVNLHKHMGDDHIDENQSPDDVLRCPLCEAIFYHLDAYELHLTFHSDTDVYSEQNDIVKSITEFSLEAVPPLMEKVENEVQEDDEANMSSMGIENFLQQAMNESNDNSNSDTTRKKKKHKKHKKSKKATITLDEFLSMNTEVFGEGIDLQVQGIEEIPSQVVAKQFRKPMNLKKRPTAMQSKEIEKLRKQGIVIKKNTGNFNKPNSLAMKSNSVSTIKQKLPSMPQSKTSLSSTDDVINKLMSQGNSQIKIVKKPSQNSNSESDTGSGPPNVCDTKNDSQENMEKENQEHEDNHEISEIRLDKECKSPIQEEMEVVEVDLSKPIPLKWKDDPPFANGSINIQDKHTGSKSAMDVLKSISQHITVKPMNKSSMGQMKNVIDEKSISEAEKSEDTNNRQITMQEHTALEKEPEIHSEVLKNITKHITVRAPNKTLEKTEIMSKDENVDNFDENEKNNCRENIQARSPNVIRDQSQSKTLDALKNLSKHITIKSNKKPIVTDEVHIENENIGKLEDENNTDISKRLIQSSKKDNQSNNSVEVKNQSQSNSLDALKLLSKHITIKAPNKILTDSREENIDQHEFEAQGNDSDDEEILENVRTPQISKKATQSPNNASKSLDVLKNLSKYITIKAPNQSISKQDTESDHEDFDLDQGDIKTLNNKNDAIPKNENEISQKSKSLDVLKNVSKDITIKSPNKKIDDYDDTSGVNVSNVLIQGQNLKCPDKLSVSAHDFKSPEIRKVSLSSQTQNKSPHTTTDFDKNANSQVVRTQATTDSDKITNSQIVKKQSLDIMKKFPNITAKSLNATNTIKCVKQQVTSTQSMSIEGNTTQKCVKTEQVSKEIETYNIDDSDDEETHTAEEYFKPPAENSKLLNKSADTVKAIKKLNSNITIKSRKNIPRTNSPTSEDNVNDDDEIGDICDDPTEPSSLAQHVNAKLQETLKNLSKNICIKPTGSPKAMPKSPISNPNAAKLKCAPNSRPSMLQKNIQSTMKNTSQHVSVKSLNDTDTNKINYHSDEEGDLGQDTNVKITEMDDCSSDDEAISKIKQRMENTDSNVIIQTPSDDENEDVDSIEDQIKPSVISKKPVPECSAGTENQLVKYVNENPRLKSMQDFNFDDDDEHDAEDETPDYSQKVLNKVAINRQTNQSKAKSSQVINKEVRTVQTFQSETVIEEITTTVTKTIRTVKQESRSQNPGLPQIRPSFHRTTNFPQTQNFRGVQVRQPRPTMGAQVRHSGPRVRLGMIRPNAPMRPNVPRATDTKMPTFRQNFRAPNAQKIETRPMKIAPNAIVSTAKRPSQEPPGHFSCFKKPKESLIPVQDIPPINMAMNKANNAAQQVKMSAQMSKSNYSTTTKVMKGNTVMTSTQNKSEMSCSTEQRLSNMAGLKIVKTSKQTMQVEEKSDVSVPKRSNAMEAIERLQSMGLLVKKPRVDESVQGDDNYNVTSDDDYVNEDEQ